MAVTEYFIRYPQRRRDHRTRLHGTRSTMMLRGMSARQHKLVDRPGERVITARHVPGDFDDLHGVVLVGLEHEVTTVGEAGGHRP